MARTSSIAEEQADAVRQEVLEGVSARSFVSSGGLGVAMGLVFGVALMTALRDQGLEVISVPSAQLAGFVFASAAIGVVAAVLPARRAARLDVLKAIANE